MEYINIEKNNVPFSFNITLGAELFYFDIYYNKREDLYTISLYDSERNVLVHGEPLIYGVPLFIDCWDLKFPILQLIPKDEALEVGCLTKDNFNEQVFLAVESV